MPTIGGQMDIQVITSDRTCEHILSALAHFREEWEDLAEGESLMTVRSSVGLILVDIANSLGLLPEEQGQVLGETLSIELQEYLDQTVSLVE
jgi:hypothetical protein